MKYDVKNEHGQLTFGSFKELYVLYQRQFVSDDDLVRRHGTDQWVPAGRMPELKGSRALVADKSTPWWSAVMALFIGAALITLFRTKTLSAGWLVGFSAFFAVVAVAAFAIRRRSMLTKRFLARPSRSEAVSASASAGNDHGESTGER